MAEYTYGIDVSHWSGRLNYAAIQTTGYGRFKKKPVFNYIKASEGRLYRDNLYPYHLMASRQAGIFTGAYHYYREIYDPVVQARWFVDYYNQNGGTDLPPCLDVEIINNAYLTPSRVLECLETIDPSADAKHAASRGLASPGVGDFLAQRVFRIQVSQFVVSNAAGVASFLYSRSVSV